VQCSRSTRRPTQMAWKVLRRKECTACASLVPRTK
jgi:hypothetical protein